MGRNLKVTLEQVKTAADAMVARGVTPSVRTLQTELGGSNTTVGKFFDIWLCEQAERNSPSRSISPELQTAIYAFVDQTAAEKHSLLLEELAEFKARVVDLTRDNVWQDELGRDQSQQIGVLRSENAKFAGTQEQLRTELGEIRAELIAARHSAEEARTALALAQGDLKTLAVLEESLRQAHGEISEQRQARANAEHSAALMEGSKIGVEGRLADAIDAAARTVLKISELEKTLSEERERRIAAERDLAVITAAHGLLPGPVQTSADFGAERASRKSAPHVK